MKKQILITACILLIKWSLSAQSNILYHHFIPNDFEFAIQTWDVLPSYLRQYYVEETFDNQNRVVSLRFLKNGSNDFYRHCNQAIWIHFEYPDNQTVKVWFLDKQGKALVDLRCRLPRSKTYHLSPDHRSILSCKADYKMDEEQYKKIGWPKAFVDQMVKELEDEALNADYIDYLSKSYKKINGRFPVGSTFKKNQHYFSQVELAHIEAAL